MKKSNLLLLIFLIISVVPATATSIFLLNRGDNTVYVAADTLPSVDGSFVPLQPLCKIIVSRSFVFFINGVAGVVKQGSPIAESLIFERANLILQENVSPDEMLDQLIDVSKQSIASDYAKVSLIAPGHTQLTLVWFEGPSPVFRDVNLWGTIQNGKFEVLEKKFGPHRPLSIQGFGMTEAMDDRRRPSDAQMLTNPKESLESLLALQHTITPDAVGPPFTILKFSPNKTEWLENGDICKANTHLNVPKL